MVRNALCTTFEKGVCLFLLTSSSIASFFFMLIILEVCPNIDPPCVLRDGERICDFSQMPSQLGPPLQKIVGYLDGTLDLVVGNMELMEADLLELLDLLQVGDTYYPTHFAWAFWVAAGGSLGLAATCMFILVELVVLTQHGDLPKGLRWTRSWIMVPLFMLLLIVGWLFSMVFITGSIGTADMCFDSPAGPVTSILTKLQENFQSVVYWFLLYYVQGCPATSVPVEMDQRINILAKKVLPSLQNAAAAILSADAETLDAACGKGVAPFLVVLRALGNQLCILTKTLVDIRLLMSCENWYPLYEEIFNNAICHHAISGLSWAAATQMVILIFGLIILTLRVAHYTSEEVFPKTNTDDEGAKKASTDNSGKSREDIQSDDESESSSSSDES